MHDTWGVSWYSCILSTLTCISAVLTMLYSVQYVVCSDRSAVSNMKCPICSVQYKSVEQPHHIGLDLAAHPHEHVEVVGDGESIGEREANQASICCGSFNITKAISLESYLWCPWRALPAEQQRG